MNMQKEKRICATALFWLFAYIYAVAQKAPNPFEVNGLLDNQIVQSPEVAAMVRNITYPVNYSTGVPDITIPIYEVKCGELTLPITLSYHASGIKPNEPSGWIGQGWSLKAEPIISRKINGHVDANFVCDSDYKAIKSNAPRRYDASCDFYMSSDNETQPDEYYYSLPEKSGMFMYGRDSGNFIPIPYNNYKYRTGGRSFYVTDDNGAVFKFDGGTDKYKSTPLSIVTAWRCSAIYAANKRDSIVFGYSDRPTIYENKNKTDRILVVDCFGISGKNDYGDYPLPEVMTENRTRKWNWEAQYLGFEAEELMKAPIIYNTEKGYTRCYQLDENGTLYDSDAKIENEINTPLSTIETTHLSVIKFNGGEIRFNGEYVRTSNNQPLTQNVLRDIEVVDNEGNIVRKIIFEYDDPLRSYSRHFLKSIIFSGSNDTDKQKYDFTYYGRDGYIPLGDTSIDFWGYYNGRNGDKSLVPEMELTTTEFDMYDGLKTFKVGFAKPGDPSLSRAVNEERMKQGVIKSIKYPNGSVDEFEFEANRTKIKPLPKEYVEDINYVEENFRFTDMLTVHQTDTIYKVGGLRIKQIKTTVPGGEVNVRTFRYGRNEDGFGYTPIVNGCNYFLQEKTKQYHDIIWNNPQDPHKAVTTSRYRILSSNPIIPITYEGGINAVYDFVTEYNGTPENNSGKTTYHYKVPKNVLNGLVGSVKDNNQVPKFYMWRYCNLRNKTVYKNTAEGYQIVNTIEYEFAGEDDEYDSFPLYKTVGKIYYTTIYNPIVLNKSLIQSDVDFILFFDKYRCLDITISPNYRRLTSSVETAYTDDGRKYTTETHYGYTSNPNVTYPISKTIISLNDTVSREEYKYPAQITNTAEYNEMVSKNILSPVVYKKLCVGNKTKETLNVFTKIADGIFRPTSVQVKFGEKGNWETRLENKYNSFGKLVESVKDGKECVSYVYGYNGNNCIATVVNVRYDELLKQTSGYITSLYNKNVLYYGDFHILIQLIKGTHYTLYQYKPLIGLSAKYMPNGTTMLYDYDGLGRLKSESIKADGKTELLKSYNYNYENK